MNKKGVRKKGVRKKGLTVSGPPFWKELDGKFIVETGQYINSASIRPSSNARDVGESGVTLLYENLKAQ